MFRRSASRNIVAAGVVAIAVIGTANTIWTANTVWPTATTSIVVAVRSRVLCICVLHGHDAAAVVFPDDLVVVPPAIAKSHLGPEMARRRARRPAQEARRELDALVAAAVLGLAVDHDAARRIEVDVGIAEQVNVFVAGAQPAVGIVASAIARQPVFHLFDDVSQRRGLQWRRAQLVVDQRRVGGREDGAAVERKRQQLANGQLDSRAMAGHLFIWRRSVFSQPHGGIDSIACAVASPELLPELVGSSCAATRSGYRDFPSRAVVLLLHDSIQPAIYTHIESTSLSFFFFCRTGADMPALSSYTRPLSLIPDSRHLHVGRAV